MALNAPRTLKAPIGWRFSGLIHSGRSPSAHSAGSNGVRTANARIRVAAARMSSIVTMSTDSVFPSAARGHTPVTFDVR